MIARRSLLIGLGSLFVAPAIVRASSLMPVKKIVLDKVPVLPSGFNAGDWITITSNQIDCPSYPINDKYSFGYHRIEAISNSGLITLDNRSEIWLA
jgi:hypothetical protein